MGNVTFEAMSVETQTVNTKYGPKPTFTIVATDGTRYKCGFKRPGGVAAGTKVSGIVTPGKYGLELDVGTMTVGTGGGGGTTTPPETVNTPPPAYKGGSRPFPVPKMHGDQAIIRQNSLGHAVSTVADYIATQPTEKWPDLDAWTDLVIKVAYKYADFSSGQREMAVHASLAKAGMGAEEIQKAMEAHNKESLSLPNVEKPVSEGEDDE
jgi:hypothetical protein